MFRNILVYAMIHLSLQCAAQRDSAVHYFTTNLASGIFFREAGLYYGHPISHNSLIEISYGHRFYNLTVIENGGEGADYKLWKQTGDLFKIGYKKYYAPKKHKPYKIPYLYLRTGYYDFHTPEYITRRGSNGLNTTFREVISVDKKLINLAVGFGKSEEVSENFIFDFFLIGGISTGNKTVNHHTYGGTDGNSTAYPPNTKSSEGTLLPSFELGLNVGYYWRH